MLDINRIRQTPQDVAKDLAKRGLEVDFTQLLQWDTQRRGLIVRTEEMKAHRNRVNKEIPARKKSGEDIAPLMQQMKQQGEEIKRIDEELSLLEGRIKAFMDGLPNTPDPDVQAGGKENNQTLRSFGKRPEWNFEPQNHVDLCTRYKLIDYERGVKLGGNGFWLYTGIGAMLEWALLNYFITTHTADGYRFMLPPHILNYECGYTAGQFPKFQEDVFVLGEESFRFMLPTSETALVNLYRDEIVSEAELPMKLFAYTPCYRREAGSYRAEERGMIRGHQFNKVEMFQFTTPEGSDAAFEQLLDKAEKLMQGLGLHYQLTKLAAADVAASMARTYDIEVWLPSMGIYKEVSSVSNARDYQARRGNMRFRREEDRRIEFLHTLNASGLATSRILPAIVEQYQQSDGSVVVPEVLRGFVGMERIG